MSQSQKVDETIGTNCLDKSENASMADWWHHFPETPRTMCAILVLQCHEDWGHLKKHLWLHSSDRIFWGEEKLSQTSNSWWFQCFHWSDVEIFQPALPGLKFDLRIYVLVPGSEIWWFRSGQNLLPSGWPSIREKLQDLDLQRSLKKKRPLTYPWTKTWGVFPNTTCRFVMFVWLSKGQVLLFP